MSGRLGLEALNGIRDAVVGRPRALQAQDPSRIHRDGQTNVWHRPFAALAFFAVLRELRGRR